MWYVKYCFPTLFYPQICPLSFETLHLHLCQRAYFLIQQSRFLIKGFNLPALSFSRLSTENITEGFPMKHWMFSCEEVTRMVSESMDRDLPRYQRIGIWIHLLICKFCSRYKQRGCNLIRLSLNFSFHSPNIQTF